MKKSVYARVSKECNWNFCDSQAGRQISKREALNSRCVGWGNIMLERISSSVVSIYNTSFLLWSTWVAITLQKCFLKISSFMCTELTWSRETYKTFTITHWLPACNAPAPLPKNTCPSNLQELLVLTDSMKNFNAGGEGVGGTTFWQISIKYFSLWFFFCRHSI